MLIQLPLILSSQLASKGLQLKEEGDFKAQMFNKPQMLI
jgi:hypothetical protein